MDVDDEVQPIDVDDKFKPVEDDNEQIERKEKQTLHIHTKSVAVDRHTDLFTFFEETVVKYLLPKIDDVIIQGSGFTLSSIDELVVQVNQHDLINGNSYIELPKYLAKKRAIINVKNSDEMCFKWAVLSALYPKKWHMNQVRQYLQHNEKLNFNGIEFPMKVQHITKFEKLNPTISINVYIFVEKTEKIQPLRLTKEVKSSHIHLLLLTESDDSYDDDDIVEDVDNCVKSHYCWIKNLSRLISSQISNHNGQLFMCDRCLNHFHSVDKLTEHNNYCVRQNEYQIEMPKEGSDIINFKNYKNQLEATFIIYADLETLLKKPTEKFCQSKKQATVALQEHEVYSIGYYLKCSFDASKSYYRAKRGKDCIDWFVQELYNAAMDFAFYFNENIPKKMSNEDESNFQNAKICHICEKPFQIGEEGMVRDHSHFTGKFRGAAHSNCNLQYNENRTIPVVFHNLTNYDSHFLVKKLVHGFEGDTKIIPINSEKYISFIKTVDKSARKFQHMIKFKFIDSFRFMASSLDFLSSLIPSEKKAILRQEFQDLPEEQLRVLERKGIFCYDYVDSWEKLDETSLPPKDAFYNALKNEHISHEDYELVTEIWGKFNIKSLGEYADLYLHVDVCLLAIVFENFRETCYQIYKLDPSNYYTAPGLSFDAMLRHTKVELELLKDVDMLLFIERGKILNYIYVSLDVISDL